MKVKDGIRDSNMSSFLHIVAHGCGDMTESESFLFISIFVCFLNINYSSLKMFEPPPFWSYKFLLNVPK